MINDSEINTLGQNEDMLRRRKEYYEESINCENEKERRTMKAPEMSEK